MAEDVTLFVDDSVACEGPPSTGRRSSNGRDRSTTTRCGRSRPPSCSTRSGACRRCRSRLVVCSPCTSSGSTATSLRRSRRRSRSWCTRRLWSTCSTATTAVSGSCSTAPMRIRCRSTSSRCRSGTSTPCRTTSAPSSRRSRATTLSGSCRADTPPSRTSRRSLPAPTCSSSASARRSPTSSPRHRGPRRSLRRGDPTARSRTSRRGLEPVLHVGSRRGVPYRSKLPYRLLAPLAPLPHFLDDATIAALLASPEPLDFFATCCPLVAKEIGWAYYHELFVAHPERTTTSWDEFAAAIRPGEMGHRARRAPHRDRARPRRPLRHRLARPAACRRRVRIERRAAPLRRRSCRRRRRATHRHCVQRRPRGVHRHARDGRGTAPHRAPRDPTVAARGHQHVVAELLHVLRQWSAAGSAAAAARARRRRARALRRRRHGRPCRRRDRILRGHELEPSRPDPRRRR